MFPATVCPCGSDLSYDACCGRLHRGEAEAVTAEQLMRSRYAAYAVDDHDYIFRTWHPRTRPDDLEPHPRITWVALEILETVAGGPAEDEGVVEFRAHFRAVGGPAVLQERSRFARRAGRWTYVDGDVR